MGEFTISYTTSNKDSFALEVSSESDGKLRGDILSSFKLKISGNNYVESVVQFLNNKYSLIDNDEKRQLENNSDNNSTEHVWLDGCRIYFRNNMIHKFIPDFISYRHMLEELLINKTNGIAIRFRAGKVSC